MQGLSSDAIVSSSLSSVMMYIHDLAKPWANPTKMALELRVWCWHWKPRSRCVNSCMGECLDVETIGVTTVPRCAPPIRGANAVKCGVRRGGTPLMLYTLDLATLLGPLRNNTANLSKPKSRTTSVSGLCPNRTQCVDNRSCVAYLARAWDLCFARPV